jgi:hypothetical protein
MFWHKKKFYSYSLSEYSFQMFSLINKIFLESYDFAAKFQMSLNLLKDFQPLKHLKEFIQKFTIL